MVKFILIKSPDEWATTKQACREELVVYLSFSSIYKYVYINIHIYWFNALQHKENLSFICFDVCDFYPSITEKLLTKALDFANIYRPISADEKEITFLSKQSLLFSNDCPWEKKSSASRFDITMGSFDGAETCELVGCYLLSCLTKKYGNSIGQYRDDGLAAFNSNPQQIERIKKGFCQIFRENDLKTVKFFNQKIN